MAASAAGCSPTWWHVHPGQVWFTCVVPARVSSSCQRTVQFGARNSVCVHMVMHVHLKRATQLHARNGTRRLANYVFNKRPQASNAHNGGSSASGSTGSSSSNAAASGTSVAASAASVVDDVMAPTRRRLQEGKRPQIYIYNLTAEARKTTEGDWIKTSLYGLDVTFYELLFDSPYYTRGWRGGWTGAWRWLDVGGGWVGQGTGWDGTGWDGSTGRDARHASRKRGPGLVVWQWGYVSGVWIPDGERTVSPAFAAAWFWRHTGC